MLLRVAAFLLVAFCIWMLVVQVTRRSFSPPDNAKTIAQLSRTGEPIEHLSAVAVGSDSFYVWLGRTVWLAAPSGPACYVFDSAGKMVAFTPTTGDGELGVYCDGWWKRSTLTLSQVLVDIERSGK